MFFVHYEGKRTRKWQECAASTWVELIGGLGSSPSVVSTLRLRHMRMDGVRNLSYCGVQDKWVGGEDCLDADS
jgi:hypothetical protein